MSDGTNTPNQKNGWGHDTMAELFNTYKDLDEIHPDAAVNIYVGWPPFFEQIRYQMDFLGKKSLKILDFGCGAGEFCNKLHMKGHTVVGIDKSNAMLDIAKSKSPKEIDYCLKELVDGGIECVNYYNQMDMVTAMHSFDWNEDVESIIKQLSEFLTTGGLMLFAVFPKQHVIDYMEHGELFEELDSNENPTKGICNFDGIKIPFYIKEPKYYDELFDNLNYQKVVEFYPPYPQSFLNKYKWTSDKYSEMVILGYRKNF